MYKICFVEDEVDLQTVVKLYLEKQVMKLFALKKEMMLLII